MSAFYQGCEGRYATAGWSGRNGCRTGREQDDLIWRLTEQAGRCFPRGQTGSPFGELRISDISPCSGLTRSLVMQKKKICQPPNRGRLGSLLLQLIQSCWLSPFLFPLIYLSAAALIMCRRLRLTPTRIALERSSRHETRRHRQSAARLVREVV